MKKFAAFLLILALALCTGCRSAGGPDAPLCRVVTQVRITRESGGESRSVTYTDQESMGAVLSYLRRLKPYYMADSRVPEVRECRYQITLDYSDGTQHVYQQLDSSFFQDSSGIWKQIDEKLGKDLTLLFDELSAGEPL